MPGGERRDTDDMGLLIDGAPRCLRGRCEKIAHRHIKTEIGEGGGDDLLASVMAILPHLGDENFRRATIILAEGAGKVTHAMARFTRLAESLAINT